jgi:prepilin-type N-terminal cleavage/methylation domain-containing protein
MRPLPALARAVRRGFTMIELLLVVAMIGVMVAIIGPRFRINEGIEVQMAGMQLVQDLELARTRALATRSGVKFVVESGAEQEAWVGYLDHDQDGTIGESDTERLALRGFGRRLVPARVTLGRGSADPLPIDANGSPVTFADATVWFSSRGLTEPMGTAGVVYLSSTVDPTRAAAVSVSGSGAMRLWIWRNGAWE